MTDWIRAAVCAVFICLDIWVEGYIEISFQIGPLVRLLMAYGVFLFLIGACSFSLPTEKGLRILHILGSILFGIFSCAGNYTVFENKTDPMTNPGGFLLLVVLSVCTWSILFSAALNSFHVLACAVSDRTMTWAVSENRKGHLCIALFSFVFCMMCYLPYLLRYYPAIIEFDSWTQLQQVFGSAYSNHHPWLHTMMLKGIYNAGYALFRSENRAIALYSLCSMGMLSVAFAVGIAYLYRRGLHIVWCSLVLLINALSPINGIYSIIIWKDIPFAAWLLLFIVLLCKIEYGCSVGQSNRIWWILLVPVSFFMCFFRSNGLYIYILMIPVMLYLFWKQREICLVSVVAVLCLAFLYKGPIFQYFGVQEADTIESLSIPAQQIAAVVSYKGNIEDGDMELLGKIVDISKVPEAYLSSTSCSDAIKDLVRETDNQQYLVEHKDEYFTLWLRLGLHNFYYYLKAYIDETRGFWYHKTKGGTWGIAVYESVEGLGINRDRKLPETVAAWIDGRQQTAKMMFSKYFSCGLYIYVLLFTFIESIRQKKGRWFIALPLICLWFTLLIATPYFSDIRYIYAIHVALPYVMAAMRLVQNESSQPIRDVGY